MNVTPLSTTFIRKNNEHIDLKDVRFITNTFLKQNLNFIEILFTPFYLLNSDYEDLWKTLIANREDIARCNPWKAVKSMKGIALNKYDALQKPFEGKLDVLAKYGYDPKQLHHLLRIEDFMTRYIAREPYIDCMKPKNREYLIDIKRGILPATAAIKLADKTIANINTIEVDFCSKTKDENNIATKNLLQDVQYGIIHKSIELEMKLYNY